MISSIANLRELFDYGPETGVLTHKDRPRERFKCNRDWLVWNKRYAGKPAGWKSKGYLTVTINHHERIPAHWVAWALTHGRWPAREIDHRNGDRSDNRLINLREATHAENGQNIPPAITRGVCFDASTPRLQRRFRSNIKVDGKQIWLGSFGTREEAHAAYLAAKARFHTFQPVPREMLGA